MSAPNIEDARELMGRLAPIQEKKGYFFNPDTSITLDLLQQLLTTKARYGYMTCPCRLASGVRENDKDIICPCEYRAPDVAEYGICYCGLYVDAAHRDKAPDTVVPERRPVEKMFL